MAIHEIVASLISDLGESVPRFASELVLCATILVMLAVRVFNWGQKISAFGLAMIGLLIALGFAVWQGVALHGAEPTLPKAEIFTGMLVFDSFTVFFRCLLLVFAIGFCKLTWISGVPDQRDGADFYTLVLGATLGFCLMVSANHLLMVFLAVEMASVPSYVLAGLLRGRRRASEAALKYSIYGAGAAGIMLYGISLLAGVLGSAHLPTMAQQIVDMDIPGGAADIAVIRVLALAGLMVMVGLAFKLSAVPFHFWCPDVFEGATAEIGAFLSVASKAAAFALLVRVALGFSYASEEQQVAQITAPAQIVLVSATQEEEHASSAAGSLLAKLQPVRSYIVLMLALLAAITCTFGNLAAYGQTNIKRMLAYSTIAHAGYMLMPVAAAVAAIGYDLAIAKHAVSALTFYLTLYLFMNLGAFAVVAFLRNSIGSEEIADYGGLIRSVPLTVICFSALLLSLLGLPPLAGFIGKLAIFMSLVNVGGPVMMTLLVIAGLNTVVSLVYYLRVVKVMTIDPEPDSRGPATMGFVPAAYMVALTVPVLVFGLFFNEVYRWAWLAVDQLFL